MSDFQRALPPSRPRVRQLAWSLSLLGLLLTACPQAPPQEQTAPREIVTPDGGLHFDMRYYDSIEMTPRSARTERQLVIFTQLQRLHLAKPYRNKQGQIVPIPEQSNDSIYEQASGGAVVGFANEAAQLADIYRKIDSLKVLEHLPVTPH